MRTLQIALAALVLAAVGCRSNTNQVLLERDLRLQEDHIYELECMLEDACAAREATLRENEALKRELSGERGPGGGAEREPAGLPSAEPRRLRESQPKLELPRVEVPELPDSSGAPGVETAPGVEVSPGVEQAPGVEAPGLETAPPAETKSSKPDEAVLDGPPATLVINKRLTGGMDRDGQPGDEGVMLAVEPRDAAGHLVNGPGRVSVVVLDPALEGEAGRVARWDFQPDEVPSHFHLTPLGRGLHFDLPWPAEPPKNRDLQLFVRFTTLDGKKITVDAPIKVRGPALAAGGQRQPPRSERSDGEAARRAHRDDAPKSRLVPPRSADNEADEAEPDPGDEPVRHDTRQEIVRDEEEGDRPLDRERAAHRRAPRPAGVEAVSLTTRLRLGSMSARFDRAHGFSLMHALPRLRAAVGAEQKDLRAAGASRHDHALARAKSHLPRRQVRHAHHQPADERRRVVGALDAGKHRAPLVTAQRQRQLDQLLGLGHLFGRHHAGHPQVDLGEVVDRNHFGHQRLFFQGLAAVGGCGCDALGGRGWRG